MQNLIFWAVLILSSCKDEVELNCCITLISQDLNFISFDNFHLCRLWSRLVISLCSLSTYMRRATFILFHYNSNGSQQLWMCSSVNIYCEITVGFIGSEFTSCWKQIWPYIVKGTNCRKSEQVHSLRLGSEAPKKIPTLCVVFFLLHLDKMQKANCFPSCINF